jgi:mono/diheme cytochrome c family protein
MMRRILGWTAALLLVLIVGFVVTVLQRWDRTFEAPLPDIHASGDPNVIATGRYLVYGPAHCANCHVRPEQSPALARGEEPPLSGGVSFHLPPGTFRAPNLTPDRTTGIGAVSDGQLARMLRYGVRRDGRAAVPFMNYHQLSDADLTAVISFLRSQPAVSHEVPPHDFNFLGKAVMSFLIEPIGPRAEPAKTSPAPGPTVERGEYLVSTVGECADCHTQRSMVDGSFTGPRLAGGAEMRSGKNGLVLVPPNLTPDPSTGRLVSWSEDQFVTRFRQGKLIPESPMPWNAFARMTEDDLRAVYRYLRSVPPVAHDPGASVRRR